MAQNALASEIVHVADGDCSSLTAIAAATTGNEPALVVLSRNGHYEACLLHVSGTITIDGAGVLMPLVENRADSGAGSQISLTAGSRLTLRNLNLGVTQSPGVGGPANVAQPKFLVSLLPAIDNFGTLVLDAVSISDESFGGGIGEAGGGLIGNRGISKNLFCEMHRL